MIAADPRLQKYRTIWRKKPVLRAIYADYYRQIMDACRPGVILEIGGGSGNLKEVAPAVVSTDVLSAPWIDAVADAQALPFLDSTFDNIVVLDVLHHLEQPRRFLTEAQRVLRSGGRLILVEPAITPLSWFVYKWFHHEPVLMGQDPLSQMIQNTNRDPYDGNSAIPTLLFRRNRSRMAQEFPELVIREFRLFSFIAFPLSGGFRSWSLLPKGLVEPLLRFEARLSPVLGRWMAFRLFVMIERR